MLGSSDQELIFFRRHLQKSVDEMLASDFEHVEQVGITVNGESISILLTPEFYHHLNNIIQDELTPDTVTG